MHAKKPVTSGNPLPSLAAPLHILLVEDNDGDILLITDALEEAHISFNLSVVKDGQDAIEFFTRNSGSSLPDVQLVLLDINLPKKNGFEVLQFLKATATLSKIPVVMLTTSSTRTDMEKADKYAALDFLVKPASPQRLIQLVHRLQTS